MKHSTHFPILFQQPLLAVSLGAVLHDAIELASQHADPRDLVIAQCMSVGIEDLRKPLF